MYLPTASRVQARVRWIREHDSCVRKDDAGSGDWRSQVLIPRWWRSLVSRSPLVPIVEDEAVQRFVRHELLESEGFAWSALRTASTPCAW